MNSERNVTFKMGNEFLCKRSVPRADEEIPVKKNSKRKHSDKKDSDMIEKNLKQIKKIKKRRSELKEFKDILLKIAQPPSITVFANNFSLGSDFFDLQKSFIDDTNNSFCIVKEQQKKLDIKIVEPLLEKHAKFRPPISEERSKRIAEKNNSSLSISASSSTSGSPSTKGISLKIERSQSLSSSSSLTSDYKTFEISEELFNIRTEACAIPGLDLINESDSLKVHEIYEKMDKINPCLGKIDINFCQKESSCLKAMIKSDAIHAKYKCMGAMCSYHSSNKEMFLAHLNAHAQEQYLANDYFLNCSYCLWKFKKPQNLVDHLKDVHHFCRFQCSECFYRSVCQMSVYDHQEQFHPNQKARIIECLDVPLLKESNIDKAI